LAGAAGPRQCRLLNFGAYPQHESVSTHQRFDAGRPQIGPVQRDDGWGRGGSRASRPAIG
jgi:hypothetical protein